MSGGYPGVEDLRLEVQRELLPGERGNLVPNPSGDLGGWGWVTPVPDTLLVKSGDSLRFSTSVAQAAWFATEQLGVAAGRWVGGRLDMVARSATSVTIRARFVWLNAAGEVVGSSVQTAAHTGGVLRLAAAQVPAGTSRVQLRVDVYSSGGNAAAGAFVNVREVMVIDAATGADLGQVRRNLITNPSFEVGTAGWPPDSGTVVERDAFQATVGAASLRLRASATSGIFGLGASSSVPISAGSTVTASFQARASVASELSVFLLWYQGASLLSFTKIASGTLGSSGWTSHGGRGDAPAGADRAVLSFRVSRGDDAALSGAERFHFDAFMVEEADAPGGYFDGDTPDTPDATYAWDGTPHASTSTQTLTGASFAYEPPIRWRNILAPTHDIAVDRDELDVGTLTATILDTFLDPAVAPALRPGRAVRLTAGDQRGVDHTLFTGKLSEDVDVVYDLQASDPGKVARISLTATDPGRPLGNTSRPEGVGSIAELPWVLEGAGVPWNVNGSGDQITTAGVVSRNDAATAVDQVVLTRDTNLGYAWVDRAGVLQAWDADLLPTPTTPLLLDESDYSSLNVRFSTTATINEVLVKLLVITADATDEVVFGPYRDEASIREWGAYRSEFTVHGLTRDQIDAYAAAILAANATPRVRVVEATVPIRRATDLGDETGAEFVPGKALVDLYDLVRPSNTERGLDEALRVTRVQHRITPGKWLMTVGFDADGSVAVPQVTPPVQSGRSVGGPCPVGGVVDFAGPLDAVPAGWLPCDGTLRQTSDFPDLFAAVGYTHGGAGAEFRLPNLVDRFSIGAGPKALGTSGGGPTKILTAANLPPHSHTLDTRTASTSGGAAPMRGSVQGSASTYPTQDGPGTSEPFDVMPPWRAMNKIIRAV